MKTLNFVLTHHWFDEIKARRKIIEFRKKTPYWEHRLKGATKGCPITFRRGYTNTILKAELIKITPYGYSALPQDVQEYMGNDSELLYGVYFKLTEVKNGKRI